MSGWLLTMQSSYTESTVSQALSISSLGPVKPRPPARTQTHGDRRQGRKCVPSLITSMSGRRVTTWLLVLQQKNGQKLSPS